MLINADSLTSVLSAICPRGVVGKARRVCDVGAYSCSLEETATLARASAKRLREFEAGRSAAKAALKTLGVSCTSMPRNSDGTAQWPAAFIGSISHTSDFAVAVVAAKSVSHSIGVDIEQNGAVTDEVSGLLFSTHEIEQSSAMSWPARVDWKTLGFSAKEAYYKFQFQLCRRKLTFLDVAVRFELDDASSGRFAISGAVDGRVDDASQVAGRWTVFGSLVVTVCHARGKN